MGGRPAARGISRAGGPKWPDYETSVTLVRNGHIGKTMLQSLVREPAEDIFLRPGDSVYVRREPRFYTALGAAGHSGQYPIDVPRLTLAESIGRANGLLDSQADPTGVFLLRWESRDVLRRIGRRVDHYAVERIPTIYHFDLQNPNHLLASQQVDVMDKDVVYISMRRRWKPQGPGRARRPLLHHAQRQPDPFHPEMKSGAERPPKFFTTADRRHCERSEAIQSNILNLCCIVALDCFAALAMTRACLPADRQNLQRLCKAALPVERLAHDQFEVVILRRPARTSFTRVFCATTAAESPGRRGPISTVKSTPDAFFTVSITSSTRSPCHSRSCR